MKLSLRVIDKLYLCLLWILTNDSMDCNNKIVLTSVYCYCVSLTLIFKVARSDWWTSSTVSDSSMILCDNFAGWANVVNLYNMCCGHMQRRCSIILDSSLFCMTLCDNLAGWANVVSLYMCCGHMQCRCSIIIIMIIILYVVIILCMCTLHGWSILCKSVMLAPQYMHHDNNIIAAVHVHV